MATDNTLFLGLLFVIAAGIGWAVARYTQSGRVEERAERRYARRYFEGLNFLLDEQPDKAAEVFASMAGSEEEEDIDVQFALGHIFRRRGEVQRAIQIHQNLLARPGLSRGHRDRALYGLAEDYLKAGLLDRAENLFEEVSGSPTRGEAALRMLIRIYEQEREWQQAVAAQNRLASISRRDDESVVAHYYCELAEQAEAAGDLDKARALLQRARHADRDSPRGRLTRARIAARQGDHRLAVRLYRNLLLSDPGFAGEALPHLLATLRDAGQEDRYPALLEELLAKQPSLAAGIAHTAISEPGYEDPVSQHCVQQFVENDETLTDLFEILRVRAAGEEPPEDAVERIVTALRRLAKAGPRYRCTQCGFSGSQLYWQCPSCKSWDTTRPLFLFRIEVQPAGPKGARA